MNWKLILIIGLFGPILAAAGNYGIVGFDNEPYIALAVFALGGILFSVFRTGKYFIHGFVAAILFGILMTMVRLKFMQQYINANPDSIDKGEHFLQWVHYIRSMKIILSLLVTISGIISGILASGIHLIFEIIWPVSRTAEKD